MSSTPATLLYLALVLAAIQVSYGIRCYQCATTSPTSPCIHDYLSFVNSTQHYKNCSDTYDRCMIETLEKDGAIDHFHRGCHNGKHFDTQFDNPRFHNITPTNETTCAKVVTLACYTFCDTDFCNGPQPIPEPPDPCANVTTGPYDYYDDLPPGCGAGRVGVVASLLMVGVIVMLDNML